MPFNKNINGLKNEYEFIKELNKKKVKQLNPLFQDFIFDIFKNVDYKDIIYCKKNLSPDKTDIFITINNITKNISIKKGVKNSVHVERITDFIHFLIESNISRESVIEYLKYHYADGTTNGKGTNRLSAEEYKKENQNKIDELNKELNNKEIIIKSINRFILSGRENKDNIDAIIYGVTNDFIWIKKEEIINIILSKKDNYSSAVHISSLICQPLNRCINKNPTYENKRYCVQIKWYNISDDIIETMNQRVVNGRTKRSR